MRDDPRAYVVEWLGGPHAMLVTDETGDLRKTCNGHSGADTTKPPPNKPITNPTCLPKSRSPAGVLGWVITEFDRVFVGVLNVK